MNIPLSIFPATLLRLILCGGGGLVPAWGPLACPDWSARAYAWDPTTSDVTFPRGMSEESSGPPRPLVTPEAWLMPLDAESPWAARLAMVAAWMAHPRAAGGALCASVLKLAASDCLNLNIVTAAPWVSVACQWSAITGDATCRARGVDGGSAWEVEERKRLSVTPPSLPTLPARLVAHPPVVALLLALYDVPEIRARVESA